VHFKIILNFKEVDEDMSCLVLKKSCHECHFCQNHGFKIILNFKEVDEDMSCLVLKKSCHECHFCQNHGSKLMAKSISHF